LEDLQITENTSDYDFKSPGISNPPNCWQEAAEESIRLYPGLDWAGLELCLISKLTELTDLPDDFVELLSQTLKAVREDTNLSKLVWLWHYLLFIQKVDGSGSWPLPDLLPDHLKSMFPAVVILSGLQQFLDIHKNMGIPDAITRNCLLDIGIWADDYKTKHGKTGFSQTSWLQPTLTGRLFRLARLQFIQINYSGNYHVYRNIHNRQVIALAGNEMCFRSDGQVDGTNGIFDPKAWMSTLKTENQTVTGYPVSSDGRVINKPITLQFDEWELVLNNGTGVIDVHIPAGAKMDCNECIESYRMAIEFFPKYFPDKSFAGFVCSSWLLDPNLQEILPAESNIVRFLREYYIMPLRADDGQTFERVFGSKPEDLSKAPCDTTLRRAILDHMLSGHQMHGAFGFIPFDEVGSQHHYYLETHE
jgi:hypothetical protein